MISSASERLHSLLEPLSDDHPCGEFLRYSDVYDQIREARRQDEDNLPQGVWKTEIKKADWDQVAHLCQEVLTHRTKDLQIAAWLMEAWMHLEGISGLKQGLDLIFGLTKAFWADIHPHINKTNYELRLVPYEWMNTRLSQECQYIFISAPSDRTTLPYRLLDFNEAQRHELTAQMDSSQEVPQSHSSSRQKISLSMDKTPTAFYRYLDECCVVSLKKILELEEELRFRLKEEAPTFYRLREKVEAVQRFAVQILKERGDEKEKKKTENEIVLPSVPLRPTKKSRPNSIESREQAYETLGEVATYLERIEPHSPTPYLIRRAMAWGEMSLPQVFKDMLVNGNDLSLLLDILNVEKDQKEKEKDMVIGGN
jgi:type VI secretion system protein ImpA